MVSGLVEDAPAALHGTDFLLVMVRLQGGQAKCHRHHGVPAQLASLARVVEEVGLHADDADPLTRAYVFDLLVVLPLITTLLLRRDSVDSIAVPATSGLSIVALAAAFEERIAGCRRGRAASP